MHNHNVVRNLREFLRQGASLPSMQDTCKILDLHARLCWHTEQYHNNPAYHANIRENILKEQIIFADLKAVAKKYQCDILIEDDGFTNTLVRADGERFILPVYGDL